MWLLPKDDQVVPSQLAMELASCSPAVMKSPPTISSPLYSVRDHTTRRTCRQAIRCVDGREPLARTPQVSHGGARCAVAGAGCGDSITPRGRENGGNAEISGSDSGAARYTDAVLRPENSG